jgi:drug/metabolite transporter (DMT)-like permease
MTPTPMTLADARPRPTPGNVLVFVLICLTWGLSWTAVKAGIATIPPFLFGGTRFVVAGLILLVLAWIAGARIARPDHAELPRLILSAGLMTAGNAGPMFWGIQFVPTALAGVVNLSLIPIGLYVFALLHRAERFRIRHAAALALGTVGLTLLFSPDAVGADPGQAFGLLMIVVGTFSYAWGAILCRPLVERHGPMGMSGWICLIGGALLLPLSMATEPWNSASFGGFLDPAALGGWLFMTVLSSVVAFTLYLRLQRDWGPARAGLYAFVSPIVAVIAGVGLAGETLSPVAVVGMCVLGLSAWLALRRQGS